ncbi:MAG: O-antigen ligase family protein [bacterium]|jgi:putative inorganic carbon (HCO3(-)) transporter
MNLLQKNLFTSDTPENNYELYLGFTTCALLASLLFFFPSYWTMMVVLLPIIGAAVLWFGYDYFPYTLFLLLAFSVEVEVTSDTRVTLPTEVLIPLFLLLLIGEALVKGKMRYRPSSLNGVVCLFFLMATLSLIYSEEPLSTAKALIRDTGYVFAGFFLVPRFIHSDRRIRQLLIGCLIVHILLILYGFGTQVVGGLRIYSDIAAPFFIEHCIYAAYITFSFAFLLAFFMDMKSGTKRTILGFITLLFVVAIALTFVRAAWICVCFVTLFYLIQFRKRDSVIDLVLLLMLGIMFCGAVIITTEVGEMITERLETVTDLKYVANFDRIDRWQAAWEMWKDHKILGVGYGAYGDVYFDYTSKLAFSSDMRMGAHNLYLEIMAELGLIGLFIYLLMMLLFFVKSQRLKKRVQSRTQWVFIIAMQGAMLTYLLHAFLNNLGPSDKIGITFWFFMGMIPTLEAMNPVGVTQSEAVETMQPQNLSLQADQT